MKYLSHLKVLELSTVLAGPTVGRFFAEHGAQVTKVEPAPYGDVTRNWRSPKEDKENQFSAYYAAANYGKEELFLDFRKQADLEKLYLMISETDLLIHNLKTSSVDKYGLSYERCIQLNPKLKYGQIRAYDSPKEQPAYDVILQAETGYISMTGTDGEHLAKLPVAFIDLFAAHQLIEGLLLSLSNRDVPNHVEVSLYNSAISALANQATNYIMADHVPSPMGTKHPNIAPYGDLFSSKDGVRFTMAVTKDVHFDALWKTLLNKPMPEAITTNQLRAKNRDLCISELEKVISKTTFEVLSLQLKSIGIAFGIVNNLDDVFKTEEAKSLIVEENKDGECLRSINCSVVKIK